MKTLLLVFITCIGMKTVVFKNDSGYTVVVCDQVYENLNQHQYDSLMNYLSTDSLLNSSNNN